MATPKKTSVRMDDVPKNHQAVAHKYYSDLSMRVWRAEPASRVWVEVKAPRWHPWSTFFVGPDAPPPITFKESRTTFAVTDKRSLGVDARKYKLLLAQVFSLKEGKSSSALGKLLCHAKTFQEIDILLEEEATRKSTSYKPKPGMSIGIT